jgi:hypothetical protein
MGAAGAMTLFTASPQEHLALARHLLIGRGVVVKWERIWRPHHWFDALYNAGAEGSVRGAVGRREAASTTITKLLPIFVGPLGLCRAGRECANEMVSGHRVRCSGGAK